jgi:transposase
MPHRELRSYPTKYATDLTDAQWAAIAPLVVTSSPKGGRPTDIDRRAIVNALRDNHRTGCQWHLRPTLLRRAPQAAHAKPLASATG